MSGAKRRQARLSVASTVSQRLEERKLPYRLAAIIDAPRTRCVLVEVDQALPVEPKQDGSDAFGFQL
jgi:hypothetical protein